MSHGKKAQSILEFSTVITLVMAGAILMGPYLIRSINALLKNFDYASEDSIKGPIKKPGNPGLTPQDVCGDGVCSPGIEDDCSTDEYCCEDCNDGCGVDQYGNPCDVCCSGLDEDDRTSAKWCAQDCCASNCVIDGVCDAACGEDKYTCCADNCWEADDGLCCVDNGEDSYNVDTASIDPANPPWPPGTPAEPTNLSGDCIVPQCPNGVCEDGEDAYNCCQDCGRCGDLICSPECDEVGECCECDCGCLFDQEDCVDRGCIWERGVTKCCDALGMCKTDPCPFVCKQSPQGPQPTPCSSRNKSNCLDDNRCTKLYVSYYWKKCVKRFDNRTICTFSDNMSYNTCVNSNYKNCNCLK